jgi:hypothetical protein
MAIKKWLNAQSRGSLIPLSFGFFLLAMSLSFISINIASAYSVKKELTNVAESAINKSAQSINTLAYYAQLNRFSNIKRVPLDCLAANIKFHSLIKQVQIFGKSIQVDEFNCQLYEVSAQVSIVGDLPIQIPLINSDELNNLTITTQVGASSVYIPN